MILEEHHTKPNTNHFFTNVNVYDGYMPNNKGLMLYTFWDSKIRKTRNEEGEAIGLEVYNVQTNVVLAHFELGTQTVSFFDFIGERYNKRAEEANKAQDLPF